MVTKEQRQRQLARAKHERQQQRRAEKHARAKQRNQLIAAVVAVLVVAGGGTWIATALNDDDKDKAASTASDNPALDPGAASQVNTAPKKCAEPAPGQPAQQSYPAEPAMTIDGKASYEMTVKTTCGDLTIALDAAKAPHTVNSFAFLAEKKYFDHTKCHRLTTGDMKVLQCGDPTATGTGGPGYSLPDENLTGATYPAGTIAMANSGPNTGGSQHFYCITDCPLPPNYTPFGKVTSGMDVLQKVLAGGLESDPMGQGDGQPHETVVYNEVAVVKK